MSKLEKLTPEQEALIPQIRDKWINLALNSGKTFEISDVRDGVNWMYEKSGYKKPLIFVCDSPFSNQVEKRKIDEFTKKFEGKYLKVKIFECQVCKHHTCSIEPTSWRPADG